jgi:putative DNA primase/helicase
MEARQQAEGRSMTVIAPAPGDLPANVVDFPNGRAAPEEDDDPIRPPEFSDDALALRFAEKHKNGLRYIAKWSRWMMWDGTRWKDDDTLLGFDFARRVCREAAAECEKPKVGSAISSAKTVAAVERMGKADRRIAATVDQWDRDDWLLNTPGGTIDLRTFETGPHQPTDYLTKLTAVAPGGDCPTWCKFLDRVTGNNGDLVEFIRRMCGVALTGITRDHALFFLYGLGANGKSVLINAIAGILGDYATSAPVETFTASTHDRHPTELAMLRGARLVTAVETEDGRRWAEARIKALTGGDPIAARFMGQDFFQFTPKFKLVIAGNHKPGLRSVDEAIRRRFNLVPFTITIPPEERDGTLPEKLKAEWPGILQWMLDGCKAWQERGLSAPPVVVEATAAYLEGEDSLAAWIEERCEQRSHLSATSTALFASWVTWASASGELPGALRQFSMKLEARGFEKVKTRDGMRFVGLRLKSDQISGWQG